ncbi:nitrogen regulatory protein P-II 1 [Geomonas limicola]|uniref:Nitrogen regulatory protein P-II 1 n=1 Tax=Geomonas limicola TaxID=2740186 RepID=A0A6V8NF09_9BACT|nr:P-II family nitrogen regulator [Geomonas limicola]GFO70367.1 nitrogen regulatory protein P-II 1 [Geomonas limicola]
MKLIEAVVTKLKVQEVRSALEDLGVVDFMESTIMCHEKGRVMVFRGAQLVANVAEKVKLEIISSDDAADGIVAALGAIVRGGGVHDGRIAMHPYLEVV